ncbi:MAG: hypothetical protein ACLQBL_22005 [Polyangiaceae bacterium]
MRPDLARRLCDRLGVRDRVRDRDRDRDGKEEACRYNTAMGSMRETLSCIEVGLALGYVNEVDAALLGRIDQVLGTLFKLV